MCRSYSLRKFAFESARVTEHRQSWDRSDCVVMHVGRASPVWTLSESQRRHSQRCDTIRHTKQEKIIWNLIHFMFYHDSNSWPW